MDLIFNYLLRLDDLSFFGFSLLNILYIGNNRVSYIVDGVFWGFFSLKILDLKNNEIFWIIEDMNGVFFGFDKLRWLIF